MSHLSYRAYCLQTAPDQFFMQKAMIPVMPYLVELLLERWSDFHEFNSSSDHTSKKLCCVNRLNRFTTLMKFMA